MTKKAMLDYIENTGMVINFNRNRLMSKSKDYVEYLYNMAVEYGKKKKIRG